MSRARQDWRDGSFTFFLIVIVFLLTINAQNPTPLSLGQDATVHRRFEYKYSFKPPYLAQKDGTVPFFEYSGNAIASQESVRITPSLRSQKGAIWSKLPTTFEWWEVEIDFRVTGRGRIGADGLAFWFTATKGFEGPVFGSSDLWNGLGIFFDSFDNDNKHNNPYIMGMLNDGTKAYDHQKDGSTQQLSGCLRDFRNKPFPVKAKIEYYKNVLTVMFHSGMSNSDRDFEMCFRVDNVILPKAGFFGLSAATGGLADDHDVLKFSVSSLASSDMAGVPDSQTDPDNKKFEQEFEEYQKKLKDQKEQWAKEHPDQVKQTEEDWENWFTDQEKELQQIFQGQSAIREVLTELHRKMDEFVGRQERSLSILSSIQNGQAVGVVGQQPAVGGGGVIRRDEVDLILAQQREIIGRSKDLGAFTTEMHKKLNDLLSRGVGSAEHIATAGSGQPNALYEVNENLNLVKQYTTTILQTVSNPPSNNGPACPESSNCVPLTVFVILLVVQTVIVVSVLIYRDNKKDQAKKYY